MAPEQIEAALRAWGRYYGERPRPEWDDGETETVVPGSSTVHPLERARQFAPKTRRAFAEQKLRGRDGGSRRAALGAAAGLSGPLPAEYVDPVPCQETREVIGTPRPDPRYTDTIKAVQDAWVTLRRYWPSQAEIVRLHYQVRGLTRAEKAAMIPADCGGPVGLRRYKDELRAAQIWIHARIAR